MLSTLAAISIGAALGAVLRWVLGNALNAWFPHIPPGTVAANMIGAYVIGLAIAYFGSHPSLPAHWRLFIITGFCGGLTTFSTFSAELAALIQSERIGWAMGSIVVHVGGSLGLTLLGIGTARVLRLTT